MEMRVVFLILLLLSMASCLSDDNENSETLFIFDEARWPAIQEEIKPFGEIREGLVSQDADTIRIVRNDTSIAVVVLSKPKVLAQAKEEESWGFFQFPKISKTDENELLVSWSMKEDSHTAYGDDTCGMLISYDEGNNWDIPNKTYYEKSKSGVYLPNEVFLQTYTPAPKDIKEYTVFPKPLNADAISGYKFYLENELPEELKGVYFDVYNKYNSQSSIIHASLNDPGLCRYAINDLMPIVWWGDIKRQHDNSLITGVYGTFYQNRDGTIKNWGISFYKSVDNGHHWSIIGKIPFEINGKDIFKGGEGFGEPTIEILKDKSLMCVMRTGSASPMYKSFSKDGMNWSEPEAFTPNGVRPSLFLLENGVLCLASGRPGLQVRFSIDGNGAVWTEPIEMLPLSQKNGGYDIYGISCGYPDVLICSSSAFYLVYSDFKTINAVGNQRKAIMFRKIEIIKK